MLASLRGHVLALRPPRRLILDVHGVGYLVAVPSTQLAKSKVGAEASFFIFTQQTENATTLFGFATLAELEFFELLTSVGGVGPAKALEICETPREIIESLIVAGDAKGLAKTPGIGAKIAARIVLELRPKLTGAAVTVPETIAAPPAEVVAALESLGFKKAQIDKILAELPAELTLAEDKVKWFLQRV